MIEPQPKPDRRHRPYAKPRNQQHRRRSLVRLVSLLTASLVLILLAAAWVGLKASIVKQELEAAVELMPILETNITANEPAAAASTVIQLQRHTAAAREAAGDPLWSLASAVPGLGANFSAVAEVARTADDVSTLGAAPLVNVFRSLSWDSLVPTAAGTDLIPLQRAAPTVASAAHAVRSSAQRLDRINADGLLPDVRESLALAHSKLQSATDILDAAANASKIAPGLLGVDNPRTYLLMIQNNAEARASGGIPGALAEISVHKGELTMGRQSSAGDMGVMSPTIPVDVEQQQIYSGRIGKFMQDVNLTPDFPTAAGIAQKMWERETGKRVDGVISVDPVALGYILDVTGPVKITTPELVDLPKSGLPAEISGKNVVSTLLSDVYSVMEDPEVQDVYFAGVAREIFEALSNFNGDPKALLKGLSRGTTEGRVLLWSTHPDEQEVLSRYPVSGTITGLSISPSQFGIYFNDGTGAKMDYYVKRTVQLIKGCAVDGYQRVRVRVTSTNTAPENAAHSLPSYVTGGGAFGVPPGTVQTNVVAYGPVQSNAESVEADGKKIGFASQTHSGRPVGTVTVVLPPGKSSTIEYLFDKIVQHAEPKLSVTPTVQAQEDMVLDTVTEKCVVAP